MSDNNNDVLGAKVTMGTAFKVEDAFLAFSGGTLLATGVQAAYSRPATQLRSLTTGSKHYITGMTSGECTVSAITGSAADMQKFLGAYNDPCKSSATISITSASCDTGATYVLTGCLLTAVGTTVQSGEGAAVVMMQVKFSFMSMKLETAK